MRSLETCLTALESWISPMQILELFIVLVREGIGLAIMNRTRKASGFSSIYSIEDVWKYVGNKTQ